MRIDVPAALAASHARHLGADGPGWTARLPGFAAHYLRHWRLRADGPPAHGVVALVLPVVRADGTPAALKLQPLDDESRGEPAALLARLSTAPPPPGTRRLADIAAAMLADAPYARTRLTDPADRRLLDTCADAVATGDPSRDVLRRFDLMTAAIGLDRARAAAWTLGRVLQNTLWDVADGEPAIDGVRRLIATTLLDHRAR